MYFAEALNFENGNVYGAVYFNKKWLQYYYNDFDNSIDTITYKIFNPTILSKIVLWDKNYMQRTTYKVDNFHNTTGTANRVIKRKGKPSVEHDFFEVEYFDITQ
ncbi:hypothetical protein GCM10027346_14740 [Hymenobacter seoulensis]